MSKIAVCSLGFRGHVNPLLAIVAELVARGHEVTYYCTEEYVEDIAGAGATLAPYRSMFEPGFEFPRNDAAFSYFLATVLEARKVLPQVLPAARALDPDLVLYDGACLSGRLLGELLGCPTAKLCPSYASTEDYSPFEAGRRSFFESAERVAAFEAEVAKLSEDLDVEYELPRSGGHAEGLNLVCMPRRFHPNEAAFDERFVFAGPSLRDPPPRAPEAGGRPLLFLSLGTLNNKKPEFYQGCLEAFGDGEWDVVMPVGTRVDPSSWSVPENFQVPAFVPQLEVLARAHAFVSQGGMNSVQEALYLGVPLVVLPSTGEQSLSAERVEELGLGANLEVEAPPWGALRDAIERVSQDAAMATRLEEFAALSKAAGGPTTAADALEGYLR